MDGGHLHVIIFTGDRLQQLQTVSGNITQTAYYKIRKQRRRRRRRMMTIIRQSDAEGGDGRD